MWQSGGFRRQTHTHQHAHSHILFLHGCARFCFVVTFSSLFLILKKRERKKGYFLLAKTDCKTLLPKVFILEY